jgi:hypothetical protein
MIGLLREMWSKYILREVPDLEGLHDSNPPESNWDVPTDLSDIYLDLELYEVYNKEPNETFKI